jgi:hypothetical protein
MWVFLGGFFYCQSCAWAVRSLQDGLTLPRLLRSADKVPAHGAVLADMERLQLAVLHLHRAAVVVDVAAVQRGARLKKALKLNIIIW